MKHWHRHEHRHHNKLLKWHNWMKLHASVSTLTHVGHRTSLYQTGWCYKGEVKIPFSEENKIKESASGIRRPTKTFPPKRFWSLQQRKKKNKKKTAKIESWRWKLKLKMKDLLAREERRVESERKHLNIFVNNQTTDSLRIQCVKKGT